MSDIRTGFLFALGVLAAMMIWAFIQATIGKATHHGK
jgi:hypothetical protein